MGNLVNKYFSHNYNDAHGDETEKVEVNNLSLKDEITHQNNDMQTPPTVNKTMPADPRSVTSGINRTPIEVFLELFDANFSNLRNDTNISMRMFNINRYIILQSDWVGKQYQQFQDIYRENHIWKPI